jgi:hypothetical protein
MDGVLSIHRSEASALDLVAEQAAHGLAARLGGVVFREGDFYAVMTGFAEWIDRLLAAAGLDHVVELLVIGILWYELGLLLARNCNKNPQHNYNYGNKVPVTLLKFH